MIDLGICSCRVLMYDDVPSGKIKPYSDNRAATINHGVTISPERFTKWVHGNEYLRPDEHSTTVSRVLVLLGDVCMGYGHMSLATKAYDEPMKEEGDTREDSKVGITFLQIPLSLCYVWFLHRRGIHIGNAQADVERNACVQKAKNMFAVIAS
jgi:hypothetical protein